MAQWLERQASICVSTGLNAVWDSDVLSPQHNSLIWSLKSSFNQWYFFLASLAPFFNLDNFRLHLSALVEALLIYLTTQIRFPSEEKRVTCHWSKLTNSLGKQQLKLSTHTWPGRAPWNGGNFVCQLRQANCFSQFSPFSRWEVLQNSKWLAPRETVSFVSSRPQLRVSGKQNCCFLWVSHQMLIVLCSRSVSRYWWTCLQNVWTPWARKISRLTSQTCLPCS